MVENNKDFEKLSLDELSDVSGGSHLQFLCEGRIRNVDKNCRTCPKLIKEVDLENRRIRCSCKIAWGWFYAEEPDVIYDIEGLYD